MQEIEKVKKVLNIDLSGKSCYIQENRTPFSSPKNVELLTIKKAAEKYDLSKWLWKAVEKRKDIENYDGGFFLRVKGNIKEPVYTCFLLTKNEFIQKVHNIIVVEDNSSANLITGCASESKENIHIGVTEFIIGRDSKLTYTMIHNWDSTTEARPVSGAIVGNNSQFTNNYICLKPAKKLVMSPVARLGRNSAVKFNNVLVSYKESYLDVGSTAFLNGNGSRAEMISRALVKDKGAVIARGKIVGSGNKSKGHIECNGLLLSKKSVMKSIPELESRNPNSELSHEAAIGKINQQELWYLMSRGLSEEQATSLIVKGFLEPKMEGVPKFLKKDIDNVIKKASKGL